MHRRQTDRPSRLAGEQALDDFGREGGKGRQPAEKAGDREQLPGQRKVRVDVEQADGEANEIAADDVGGAAAPANSGRRSWTNRITCASVGKSRSLSFSSRGMP